MNIETLLSVRVEEQLEFFPEFGMRLADEAVVITARSPIFHSFFSTLPIRADDTKVLAMWRGHGLGYFIKSHKLMDYIAPGHSFYITNGERGADELAEGARRRPNLVWLTHPKLASGMEIRIKEPIPLNDLEDYFNLTLTALRDIYVQHIRTADFKAKLVEIFEKRR